MALAAAQAPSSMALAEIVRSVRSSSQNNTQALKQHAESQESSMGRMVKDLYRAISVGNRNSSSLQSTMADNAAETQRVSGKIDSTNSLLQQTLSIQSTMLTEMKALNGGFKVLSEIIKDNMNGGIGAAGSAISNVANSTKVLAALGAIGLGGAAGAAAYKAHVENYNRESNSEGAAPPTPSSNSSQTHVPANREEVKQTIISKSGSDDMAKVLLGNAMRESSLNPTAGNTRGENSQGILQLNRQGGEGVNFDRMFPRREGEPDPIHDPAKQMEYFEKAAKSRRAKIDGRDTGQTLWDFMNDPNHSIELKNKAYYQNFARGKNPEADMRISLEHINRLFNNVKKGESQLQPPAQTPTPQLNSDNRTNTNPLIQGASYTPQPQARIQPANLTPPGNAIQQQREMNQGGGKVFEDQMSEAQIRKGPISERLKRVLQIAAAEAGVDVRVKSGGQPPGGGTGSDRHDNGNAADLDLYIGNRRLSPKNPEDLPIFKKFVATAKAEGATGIGAGEGYMSQDGSRLHVGFGTEAIWGADKSSKTAADWLREATGGVSSGGGSQTAQMQPQQGQSKVDGINQLDPLGMGGMPLLGAMAFPMGMGMGGPLIGAISALVQTLSTPSQTPQSQAAAYDPRIDGNMNDTSLRPSWFRDLKEAYPNQGNRVIA